MIEYVKNFCSKYALSPKSWRGQNFLIDQKVLDKIVSVSDLKKEDVVLEAGPGFGILTKELAKRVRKVIAVEIDKNLVKALKDILKDYKNIEIIEGDILKLQILNLKSEIPNKSEIQNSKQLNLSNNYKLVANIPYSITASFLRKFLENEPRPQEMILLVQKEVAQRIIAKNKDASLLSVSVQFYSKPEIVDFVSSSSFFPEPAVESAIIKLKIRNQIPKINEKEFFKLVKIGFSSRRKQLHNNLAVGLEMKNEKIKEVLENLSFNPQIRAQELSAEDWIKLCKILN